MTEPYDEQTLLQLRDHLFGAPEDLEPEAEQPEPPALSNHVPREGQNPTRPTDPDAQLRAFVTDLF